ncbi:MAG: LysM domain-containing protein [Pseudomonadota bacterium]
MTFIKTTAIAVAVLCASAFTATEAGAFSNCGDTYTVRSGDSLGRIAKRCGSTVNAIMAANDRIKKPSSLRVGWEIQIPGGTDSSGGAKVVEAESEAQPRRITELSGHIVNSRRCAQLHTEDGQIYVLVSPKVLFRSGATVTVRGAFASEAPCGAEKTLVVSELQSVK